MLIVLVLICLLIPVHLAGLFLWVRMLTTRKSTRSMIIWSLWLILLPVLGVPLYALLGTDRIRRSRLKHHQGGTANSPGFRFDDNETNVPMLLRHIGGIAENSLSAIDEIKIFPDGDQYYAALSTAIKEAKEYICFQVYLWRPDEVGKYFLQLLVEALQRGVTVKLLIDELATSDLDKDFFEPFIKEGGDFSWCLTVHPIRNRYFFNLRNHRKIQVIDGRVAFIGGMNIGCEYKGEDPEIGPWSDMQLLLRGPVLKDLLDIFYTDWAFAKGLDHWMMPPVYYPSEGEKIPAAVVRSGPDLPEHTFLKSFILFCNHSKKTLDLFTPYFAPNESMLTAICLAAQRGVRVRLLIPTQNEHQYMVDLGRAFYEILLEAGVQIFELPGCVHHAKICLADDDWVLAGSANLDVRSIQLNFELAVVFPDANTAQKMNDHFEELFEKSQRIELAEWRERSYKEKVRQGFVRLFAPVL